MTIIQVCKEGECDQDPVYSVEVGKQVNNYCCMKGVEISLKEFQQSLMDRVVITDTGFSIAWPESGNVVATRYNTEKRILEIDFKGNKTYEYFEVPDTLWIALSKVESIGSFIAKEIKGKFNYSQIITQ